MKKLIESALFSSRLKSEQAARKREEEFARKRRELRISLCDRITDYLRAGGLFNPEYMEHDKVRDLLFDVREYLNGATSLQTVSEGKDDHI